MFTNNSNEREVLSSLVNCKFEIDLVFVKLNCDGIEISGKGVLYIKEDGQFYLKFFNDHYFGDGERFEHLLSQPRNKTPIYSFVGNDENDKKYSCNYLFSGSPVLNVTEFKLNGKIEMDFPFSYNSKLYFLENITCQWIEFPIPKLHLVKTYGILIIIMFGKFR